MTGKKLIDLGERRILREIIPRFASAVGDDCAVVDWAAPHVCITTDPVPRPAAEVIGGDIDPYWIGWLLVTINASDLAAAGAVPKAFLAALDLPADYYVADLERLLSGICDSCKANGLVYVGGNLREAKAVAGVGTAIGQCFKPPLTRRGAQLGDALVVLGKSGQFWADAEKIKSGASVVKSASPVFAPVSQSNTMHVLHELGLIICSMDTSDGLAPSLEELAMVNGLSLEVDLTSIRRASQYLDCAPGRVEKFWFGWGDWTVVAAVRPSSLGALEMKMREIGGDWTHIGTFTAPGAGVLLRNGDASLQASRLESERFAPDSWFTEGIDGYIRMLNDFRLP